MAGTLIDLQQRCSAVQSLCWAENTWKTKNSQWKRFWNFCNLYGLTPIPASVDCVCLFITYLCDSLKYSTICNYVSSIWSLHNYLGVQTIAKDCFLVKCTLRGARRLLGDAVLTADPLLPRDLLLLYQFLNHSNLFDLVFWSALCLAYRCLLRKSHYTQSIHNIVRSDLVFTEYGLCLTIRSSKTIQYSERNVVVPVIASPGSTLCPVRWLKKYLKLVHVNPSSPLFVRPGTQSPLTYKVFSDRLKALISAANLKGNYTSHSLRRGCATFLSRLGLPLHDIKTYGDWRSLSVLLYLAGDVHTRLLKDRSVAKCLQKYH